MAKSVSFSLPSLRGLGRNRVEIFPLGWKKEELSIKTSECVRRTENGNQRQIMFAYRLKINASIRFVSAPFQSQVTESYSNDTSMCSIFFKCALHWRDDDHPQLVYSVYVFCPCQDAWGETQNERIVRWNSSRHADPRHTHTHAHIQSRSSRHQKVYMIFIVGVCTLLEYSFHGQTETNRKKERMRIWVGIYTMMAAMCVCQSKRNGIETDGAPTQQTLKMNEKNQLEHEILISSTPQNILAHTFSASHSEIFNADKLKSHTHILIEAETHLLLVLCVFCLVWHVTHTHTLTLSNECTEHISGWKGRVYGK